MKNPLIEALLCMTSYGLQCQMAEQLTDKLASGELSKERIRDAKNILMHIRECGSFRDMPAMKHFPPIDLGGTR